MMKPNIYVAYLCFLDNGSIISQRFKRWMSMTDSHNELKWAIEDIAYSMKIRVRPLHIYEIDKMWREFTYEGFLKFLKECGVER